MINTRILEAIRITGWKAWQNGRKCRSSWLHKISTKTSRVWLRPSWSFLGSAAFQWWWSTSWKLYARGIINKIESKMLWNSEGGERRSCWTSCIVRKRTTTVVSDYQLPLIRYRWCCTNSEEYQTEHREITWVPKKIPRKKQEEMGAEESQRGRQFLWTIFYFSYST